MEFLNCKLNLNIKKSIPIIDKQFEKFFSEAIVAKPNFLAFDLDFDYDGVVGATGAQVNPDTVASGTYSIVKISDSEYELNAKCEVTAEFMFMNESASKSFQKAMSNGKLVIAIASLCNNGQNKKTFWSMECNPYVMLNIDEAGISMK